ncbi:MAG TPA: hypothetical protein VKF41_08460 [Bryobacteraceae bacterium]|nr:hypothetical protein [Bryobacteraceae bacterium]
MRRFLLACLAAAALFGGGSGGIPPRPRSTDYPVQRTSDGLTLAAALLTPAEAKKVFTADLDHAGFLVFEVAAYPADGVRADLSPDQFTMSPGTGGVIEPTSPPEAIVEAMYEGKRSTPQAPGKVQVSSSSTIGYETGSGGRRGGVYAGSGTEVSVGDPGAIPAPPPSPSQPPIDRDSLQVDLASRELPGTTAAGPVAGYLYFWKTFKPKKGVYELKFTSTGVNGREIVLPVPAKSGK